MSPPKPSLVFVCSRRGLWAILYIAALLLLYIAPVSVAPARGEAPGPASISGQAQRNLDRNKPFRKAMGTRSWRFPRDHGQHPDYLLEWWYYTGIVSSGDRRFGYQVTFFRRGLRHSAPRSSRWAARSLFVAHAALSDLSSHRYFSAGLLEREALGLAGAAPDRHQVWLHGWRAEPVAGDPHGVTLTANTETFGLTLRLRAGRGPVLHGENGLDRKGDRPGEASWYYSLPRMATAGTLTLEGKTYRVSGTTWMDHEFGTNQLAPDLTGWDWFGLRLEDGRALMLYRLRRSGGGTHRRSGGTLVEKDGTTVSLRLGTPSPSAASSFSVTLPPGALTPVAWWSSPHSGGRYPVAWNLSLPAQGLALSVRAEFTAQEFPGGGGIPFPYWEGVVSVSGTSRGLPIRGAGYMELTGYAGNLVDFFR